MDLAALVTFPEVTLWCGGACLLNSTLTAGSFVPIYRLRSKNFDFNDGSSDDFLPLQNRARIISHF